MRARTESKRDDTCAREGGYVRNIADERTTVPVLIGWFSNRPRTSFDDGKAGENDQTRLSVPNLSLCYWSSQLFDLRAPSSIDVPVLLLNQPNIFRNSQLFPAHWWHPYTDACQRARYILWWDPFGMAPDKFAFCIQFSMHVLQKVKNIINNKDQPPTSLKPYSCPNSAFTRIRPVLFMMFGSNIAEIISPFFLLLWFFYQ